MSSPSLVVSRRLHAERLILFGWSRAILLQLAHPLMAAAIGRHSTFRGGAVAAATRLHQTIRAMLALTFGDAAQQAKAIAGIRAIHDRVHGTLEVAAGRFPKGTPYTANDPALLLWVHATVLESIVLAHETFVAPVAIATRDTYCAESAPVAVALGVRDAEVPRTWRDLTNYVTTVLGSGALVVTEDARNLAEAVLAPPMATIIYPAAWLNRSFTTSRLPPQIRAEYGFAWSPAREVRLLRAARAIRASRGLTPGLLAKWRVAR